MGLKPLWYLCALREEDPGYQGGLSNRANKKSLDPQNNATTGCHIGEVYSVTSLETAGALLIDGGKIRLRVLYAVTNAQVLGNRRLDEHGKSEVRILSRIDYCQLKREVL